MRRELDDELVRDNFIRMTELNELRVNRERRERMEMRLIRRIGKFALARGNDGSARKRRAREGEDPNDTL